MRIDKAMACAALSAECFNIDRQIDLNGSQVITLRAALTDGRCSSEAYSAIADRIRSLRIPAAKVHLIALESIRCADRANASAIEALPESSPGVADTAEFEQRMRDIQSRITALEGLQDQGDTSPLAKVKSSMSPMINLYSHMIDVLRAQIERINEYSSSSSSLYADAESLVSGMLSSANSSVASYIATGSYGDMAWASGIDRLYDDAMERLAHARNLEASGEEGVVVISEDGQTFYYEGTSYSIKDAHLSVLARLVDFMIKERLEFDLSMLKLEGDNVTQAFLEQVGMNNAGTYRIENGKIRFYGYGPNMTKRCNFSNRYNVKARVIFEFEDDMLSVIRRAIPVKTALKMFGPLGMCIAGGVAFFEEYNRNPFYPQEHRLLSAAIDALVVGGAGTAISTILGGVGGAIVFSAVGPEAAPAGALAGSIFGGVGSDFIYYGYIHDGAMRDFKDWAYVSLFGTLERGL